jgi:hypothetical protein
MVLDPLIDAMLIFLTVLGGARWLGDEATSATAPSLARNEKRCFGINGDGCDRFGARTGATSNANTSFSAPGGEVTTLSAQILRLDRILKRYGSEADSPRQTLRQHASHTATDLLPGNGRPVLFNNPSTYELLQ